MKIGFVFICVCVFRFTGNCQSKIESQPRTVISYDDTSFVEISTEGVGTVFLKQIPKEGRYVIMNYNKRPLMEFEVNKNGEFCGEIVKYSLYSSDVIGKKNLGKCDFENSKEE